MSVRTLLIFFATCLAAQAQKTSTKSSAEKSSDSAPQVEINVGSLSSTNLDPELKKMFDSFYARLKEGKVEDAWKKLLEGSRIGQQPDIVEQFVTKTTDILSVHGKVEDVELIHVKSTGKHLKEIVYQLSCTDHPSRWRIMAYQIGERWQILDVNVSSDLPRMTE